MNSITLYLFLVTFYYNPTMSTKLFYYPQNVIKGLPVTLECKTESSDQMTYIWLKDGHKIPNIVTPKWTIPRASLDTRTNFTCVTENQNGFTSKADIFLNVIAPPAFIKSLKPYSGILQTSKNVSLSCKIECYPLCSNVLWYKNGQLINPNNTLYYIQNEIFPADVYRNDFESIESTLVWNLTNWPNNTLVKNDNPSEFTCESNSTFQDVKSSTYLFVEFPPENLTLSSENVLEIEENEIPEPITCSGDGIPKLNYYWKHTSTDLVLTESQTLRLGQLSRFQNHTYTCESFNRHGKEKVDVYFNILYKPNCSIELLEQNGQKVLVCKTDANPQNVTFKWKLKNLEEETDVEHIIESSDVKETQSYLNLNSSNSKLRSYKCIPSNSVGFGTPCMKLFPDEPFQMELSKIMGEITEGMGVVLICKVRSTSNVDIVWYNNTKFIENSNSTTITTVEENENGTFSKTSTLKLSASRGDNKANFKCVANNKCLKKYEIPPVQKIAALEVLYAPVVRISSLKTVFIDGENQSAVFFCSYDANPSNLLDVIWQKDGNILKKSEDKHTFVTSNSLSLIIKNVTREDMGEYACVLKNQVGERSSLRKFLNVSYPPFVEVTVQSYISNRTFSLGDIFLTCKIISGNPFSLSKVSWYINDRPLEEYLKEVKSEKILLKNLTTLSIMEVDENYSKNFSCQGSNQIGFGPKSQLLEIKMIYPSIPTVLIQEPKVAIKNHKVSLKCLVENLDSLNNITYFWFRRGYRIQNINTSEWKIDKTSLDIENISCLVTNGKRSSSPANLLVNIVAPPNFLKKPNPYIGVLRSSKNITIRCRIECYPLCSVLWAENGEIVTSNSFHKITRKIYPRNLLRNDFLSVESNLTISTRHIKDDRLYQYSCSSASSKSFGPEVNATFFLRLEYPPEDLTVSQDFIDVRENTIPEKIKCRGKGKPGLLYLWKNASNEDVAIGDSLILEKLSKSDEGNYTCLGYNKHGSQSTNVYIHVSHYKPICSIKFGSLGLQQALVCSAKTDTPHVSFIWKITDSDGKSETLDSVIMNSHSYFIFNQSADFSKNYICLVENSYGVGKPCQTLLPVPPSPAKIKFEPTNVLKNSNVTFTCLVENEGFPKTLAYVWFLNKENIYNSTIPKWTISSVSLDNRNSNFSCLAKNEAGYSVQSSEVSLNITAPPVFIKKFDSPIMVVDFEVKNLSLSCRIECYPLCDIVWLKNRKPLDLKSGLYYINRTNYDANFEKNLFESVESTLVWNMTNWPGQILGKNEPEAKYTCSSVGINPAVSSSVTIFVEFKPENLTVSKNMLNVEENEIAGVVTCQSGGQYKLHYKWIKDSTGQVMSDNKSLDLGRLSRSDGGYYTCYVSNKYGVEFITIYVNVLYQPSCRVVFNETISSLVCSAEGNPSDFSFTWTVNSGYDDFVEIEGSSIVSTGDTSLLILNEKFQKKFQYRCVAANPLGFSKPCRAFV